MSNAFADLVRFLGRGGKPDLISFELEFVQSTICADCEAKKKKKTCFDIYSPFFLEGGCVTRTRNDHPDSQNWQFSLQSKIMKPDGSTAPLHGADRVHSSVT